MAATCAVAGRLTDQNLIYYAEWTFVSQDKLTPNMVCRASISVSMPACHAGEQGSTPWRGVEKSTPYPNTGSLVFGLHFESFTNLFVPDVWIISPLAPLLLAILLLIDFTEPVDLAVTHATGSRAIANRGQEEPPAWEGDCSQIFQRSPSLQGCSNSTTC